MRNPVDFKAVLVTGGAGFIGSHLTRLLVRKYPALQVVNLDLLTYAGNLENLSEISSEPNYVFVKGDIRDRELVKRLFEKYTFGAVVHLAAESHVDRSIQNALPFIDTNVIGTANLLEVARKHWNPGKSNRYCFYHISTDEVYGDLGKQGKFTEESPYQPSSPYAASKAGSDHLVRSYGRTYGLPYVISNCSNNYGPNQFPEKLIPLIIQNIIEGKNLPIYGKGNQVRDWLYVTDHVEAIDLILRKGKCGETYLIGGKNEWDNLSIVKKICAIMDRKLNRDLGSAESLIEFVKDRPGHDQRYAIDPSKLELSLGWEAQTDFEKGLEETISWYLNNKAWVDGVTSGAYLRYYEKQYGNSENEAS